MKIEQIDVVSKEDSTGKFLELSNNIFNLKGVNIGNLFFLLYLIFYNISF